MKNPTQMIHAMKEHNSRTGTYMEIDAFKAAFRVAFKVESLHITTLAITGYISAITGYLAKIYNHDPRCLL